MEVILRQHVDNLGRRGEVVKVADGYARNYLLPRKLALLVTEGNKQQVERERGKFEAREQEEKKVADAMGARLAGVEIQIARKVGETEVLFGSVTMASATSLPTFLPSTSKAATISTSDTWYGPRATCMSPGTRSSGAASL